MSLASLLCRHVWYWSERHGADRCRRCGKLAETAGVAAGAAPSPEPEPMATIAFPPRPRTLTERLDLLSNGGHLSRDEVVETVMELIEDAHSARPRLSGDVAARYFAALDATRRVTAV